MQEPKNPSQKFRQNVFSASSSLLFHGFAARAAISSSSSLYQGGSTQKSITEVGDISAFIKSHCTCMLKASRNTGNLLYRGGPPSRSLAALVVTEESDLLDPKTYGTLLAVEYFNALETYLKAQENNIVLPSNGHLATPNSMEV